MANDKPLEALRPVTVDVLYRCSPFEGIRIPWILNRFLSRIYY
jgi:hypothetical protein